MIAKKKTKKKAKATKEKSGRAKSSQPNATRPADEETKNRARSVLRGLKKLYPNANCALDHQSALQLLVATILSAQSTDANVNKVTPKLFKRFPTAKAFAEADLSELEEAVRTTGFFRQKAKNIQATSRRLVDDFGGEVPDSMDDLTSLSGVARKTANVILGTWFEKNEGVVVDTHVGRLAHRLMLTWSSKNSKDAVKIENDLMEVVPRKDWTFFSHAVILHGRQVCDARKPRCDACGLARSCPSAGDLEK